MCKLEKGSPGVELSIHFWRAARAYDKLIWKDAMDSVKSRSIPRWEALMKLQLHLWARHAYHVPSKSDHNTNNMSESWNHWIGKFRKKNIVKLLEGIRMKLMSMMHERFVKACQLRDSGNSKVTPTARMKLDKAIKDSTFCNLLPASADEF
ncbi:hypothetical protein CFOL_v3_01525 [Cephalotus follicularis]|uniref:Uncharacterized protein n=1 Tax=Cephalotus follicularis TaxID=3775 RepID=A0A1Q3AQI1_CEPFO|nr:hypothetical protein CFOL_v3_01525 [Cephalotus follicularis]